MNGAAFGPGLNLLKTLMLVRVFNTYKPAKLKRKEASDNNPPKYKVPGAYKNCPQI